MTSGSAPTFFDQPKVRSFLLKFFLIFGGVEVLLHFFPPLPYQEWLAASIGKTLSLSTYLVWVGVVGGTFEVTPSCTGFTSAALFL